MALRRRRLAAAAVACTTVLGGLCGFAASVRAATWIEQAQAELTCTGLADAAERASLAAPWLPGPLDAKSVAAYFRGPPQDARQARFRHLTMLAAIGWWADQINDQFLRSDVYFNIGVLADRYAGTGDALFRQVARCARARLIGALLELDQPKVAERVADDLVRIYPEALPAQAVEDWPLLLAIRELRLAPTASTVNSLARLTTRATTFAANSTTAKSPERTSRWLAVASQGVLALGDAGKARDLALESLIVTGKPPTPVAAWRAMPMLFDTATKLNGATEAANLRVLLQPDDPPAALRDPEAAFESLLRLSQAAETQQRFDDMARLQQSAFNRLARLAERDRYSMPFYRHALDELAGTRDADLGTLAKRDQAFAAKTHATYQALYETLLRQAQSQFVGDAREQLFFQYKIDNVLHALAELHPALLRSGAQIEDTSFRLAQLRSYGRLTLATLSAELAHSNIDPASRAGVERFFSLATQTAVWLRALLDPLRIAPGSPPPVGDALWKVFFTLDVFHQETAREFDRYAAFVRQQAPSVAALATPSPQPVQEFQRRLRSGEAIVATLVTPRDLYVWAVTPSQVVLSRQRVTERDVIEKVRRLRAGLQPDDGDGAAGLPPFDAAAAHELYQLVFAPLEPELKGVTDITWYGHGPLGSVPPAVLVTSAPPQAMIRTPAEFGATRFMVDRYAFAVLADLSLFPWHRDRAAARRQPQRLLGVGAPLLSTEELAGGPRAKSYELAGGLDGKALAELPKLAESVDEMKGLAAIVGDANATLWLGPEASERRFVGDQLRGYTTIALATHGFLPGEIRDVPEPALMLVLDPASRDRFDGILTSREIARLELDADLVILSACNTASGDGRPRSEAFTGLSQAFLTAGARALMVSHWPVMSGAAVQLSVDTMEHATQPGMLLSRSLQQAMQQVRKAGAASAIEAHPSYWGPFVIVGDGR